MAGRIDGRNDPEISRMDDLLTLSFGFNNLCWKSAKQYLRTTVIFEAESSFKLCQLLGCTETWLVESGTWQPKPLPTALTCCASGLLVVPIVVEAFCEMPTVCRPYTWLRDEAQPIDPAHPSLVPHSNS